MEQRTETYKTEYEIADLTRMRLYQRSHALAVVLGALEIQVGDFGGDYKVDGRAMYLDTERLRREFLEGSEWLCQEFLHMLSHCLLGHLFRRPDEEETQELYRERLDAEAWELAERLWGEPIEMHGLVDEHKDWARILQQERLAKASGELGTSGSGSNESEHRKELSGNDLALWWRQQMGMLRKETTDRKKRRAGTAKRSRSQRLVTATGHRGDYREILQSFSAFREDSRINPEEFQYAWYEYGLQTYGNMPLIEPLEYREERKIEDLVLVIDTSGSCEKDLVRIFLEETKGILDQEELFFRKFCLHILQCDNRIQRDDKITSQEAFEKYLENLTITGGGGTDFRPAFMHIAQLQKTGEFRDLQGILYFTDGSGLYPKEEPDYEVWFVMLKNNYDTIDTPDWIHRLVLEERAEL